ncbi:MAG: hypothetical protein RL536_543 [Candidatus Parcubacteria bacterium]|jgi:hypothetical protein
MAREKRLLWRDSNLSCYDFDHPEYQELWEMEIGAEDIYLLSINGLVHGMSWADYCHERQEFENDNFA